MFGPQRTIRDDVEIVGVGAHTGHHVRMRLLPAPVDKGVVFRRVDLPGKPEVKASWKHISQTVLSTQLTDGAASVQTVEHLLSAVSGLGIDNLLVEIDGLEVPLTDGSSQPFVGSLQQAGVVAQHKKRKVLVVRDVIEYREDDSWVRLSPDTCARFSMTLSYDAHLMKQNSRVVSLEVTTESYIEEISRARTYAYFNTRGEIAEMQKNGYGLGCGVENAILVCGEEILNPEGFRIPNEFTRHKILDAIGDLRLLGHPIMGHYEGYKAGHAKNAALMRALMQNPRAWELVTAESEIQCSQWSTKLPRAVNDL